MALVRRGDDDYHLRIVSYYGDPESRRFRRKVDDFLEELYELEDLDLSIPGGLNIQPPLAFSDCRLSQHDGRQVVLVKLSIRVASQIFSTLSKYHRLDSSCPRIVHLASLLTRHLQTFATRFSNPMHLLLHEP
jgi:hypothetical protein